MTFSSHHVERSFLLVLTSRDTVSSWTGWSDFEGKERLSQYNPHDLGYGFLESQVNTSGQLAEGKFGFSLQIESHNLFCYPTIPCFIPFSSCSLLPFFWKRVERKEMAGRSCCCLLKREWASLPTLRTRYVSPLSFLPSHLLLLHHGAFICITSCFYFLSQIRSNSDIEFEIHGAVGATCLLCHLRYYLQFVESGSHKIYLSLWRPDDCMLLKHAIISLNLLYDMCWGLKHCAIVFWVCSHFWATNVHISLSLQLILLYVVNNLFSWRQLVLRLR